MHKYSAIDFSEELRENDLVKQSRKGKMVYYSLADNDVLALIEKAEKYIFTR